MKQQNETSSTPNIRASLFFVEKFYQTINIIHIMFSENGDLMAKPSSIQNLYTCTMYNEHGKHHQIRVQIPFPAVFVWIYC